MWAGAGAGGSNGGVRGNDRRLSVPPPERPQQIVERHEQPLETFTPSSAYMGPEPEEAGLDLRKYVWLLFKHRWLVLGSVGVFICLGLLATFLTTPLYQASTTVQINRDTPDFASMQSGQDAQLTAPVSDAEFYQTQYELLKSRTLAERVVADLGLQDDPAFLAAVAPSAWTRIRNLFFGGGSASKSAAEDVSERQKAAAARILGNMDVAPVRSSSIVKLSYDSPNPALAAKIVNALASSFIKINLERRYNASTYARNFLQDRLTQLKAKLEESEKALVAYAEKERIVSAGDKQTLAQSNLQAANNDYAKASTDRLKAQLLWEQAQASDGLSLPQVLEDKAVQKLRETRAALQQQYQDKLGLFKPDYPEMKQLKGQIDEVGRQIAAEIGVIKDSIKAQYDAAVAQEKSLADQVNTLKSQVTDFQNRNIQYTILQREVDTNRQLYDGLLQRYKEIGVAGGVGVNNISIVDNADVPARPYKPSLPRNLAISLMLGLLFGAGAAFAREQFDDTFKSPEDLEENLGLPLLGLIPLAQSAEEHAKMLDDPRSALSEAYRSLRTSLQFSTTTGLPKSLLVTSSRAGEGKSTTARTLARNFSDLGMNVLLIDADLRKPSLHEALNLDNDVGLTNCLTGAALPPDVFQQTGMSGLTFMASGPLPPNPAELLAGPRMLSLLTIAAEQYDVVVVDGPPVAGLADAPLLASMAIGTLLVIDAVGTRRGVAKAALKRLHFARAQLVGAVVNKVDISAQSYGYRIWLWLWR